MSADAAFSAALPLLPERGARVLVMVSGGADSVALLDLVYATRRWTVVVFHLDHAMRAESIEDAAFVAARAARARPGAGERARGHRPDRAAPGRRARGCGAARALPPRRARAARRLGAQAILTAHHRDDQAETVLMHLLRGSGEAGLRGMAPRRAQGAVPLVRPLLVASRAELRDHLRARGLAWREDASNGDGRFRRNHLRARVLPLLEASERGFTVALLGLGAARGEVIEGAEAESAALLRELAAHGLAASRAHVRALRALARGPMGSAVTLGRWRIARAAGALAWQDRRALAALRGRAAAEVALPGPGSARRGRERLTLALAPAPQDPRLPAGQAWLDAAALRWPLTWRAARADERWTPLGSPGRQRVRKSLADRKVPALERPGVGVLADAEGVVWVPGLAIAERVRVTRATVAAIHGAVEPVPRLGGGGRMPAS